MKRIFKIDLKKYEDAKFHIKNLEGKYRGLRLWCLDHDCYDAFRLMIGNGGMDSLRRFASIWSWIWHEHRNWTEDQIRQDIMAKLKLQTIQEDSQIIE